MYTKNGESAVISAEEIGLSCSYAQSAEAIKELQNPLLWPGAMFGKHFYTIDYTVSYDDDRLREALAEIPFFQEENMVAPQNAYIGTYIFKRENYGKKTDHAHGGAYSFNRNSPRSNYCYR